MNDDNTNVEGVQSSALLPPRQQTLWLAQQLGVLIADVRWEGLEHWLREVNEEADSSFAFVANAIVESVRRTVRTLTAHLAPLPHLEIFSEDGPCEDAEPLRLDGTPKASIASLRLGLQGLLKGRASEPVFRNAVQELADQFTAALIERPTAVAEDDRRGKTASSVARYDSLRVYQGAVFATREAICKSECDRSRDAAHLVLELLGETAATVRACLDGNDKPWAELASASFRNRAADVPAQRHGMTRNVASHGIVFTSGIKK